MVKARERGGSRLRFGDAFRIAFQLFSAIHARGHSLFFSKFNAFVCSFLFRDSVAGTIAVTLVQPNILNLGFESSAERLVRVAKLGREH